ncbi:MAG: ribonuclease HII [Flavobacteriaceae bacterium]|nr:ribonuclease HII [Flavobacteriaceae bacterium]MCY4266783.1 ribonuclease HII [Flavobacteriaceae bacterium]MCY4298819.1 ribonuclease HII [Flavobacteriaceae bacterium]
MNTSLLSSPQKKKGLLDYPFDGLVAGIDEAGRGAIAGPVTAAVVILKENHHFQGLNDSKLLTHFKREKLRKRIEKEALYWSVAHIGVEDIDKQNILNATFKAMHKALDALKVNPDLIIVDGNRFISYRDLKFKCIIQGDRQYKAIAAASILAKTHRDCLMKKLDIQHPHYQWKNNKGYPTPKHKIAVKKIGLTQWHRKTFQCQ